jgi:dTDP-4-amino-4,6-dideoxygalactose transaminase
LIDYLKPRDINWNTLPIALPKLKAYAYLNHNGHDFPEATKAAQEILSLPMFPELEEPQIKYIADKIRAYISGEIS